MAACKFCDIIAKQANANIIYEDENFISFLDIRPLFLGHCLLIPKTHFVTLYDLPDEIIQELFLLAKRIGKAIEIAMQAKGSFIAANNVVSQSVPHFHLHMVPRNVGDGLKGFFWPRTNYASAQEMHDIQLKIHHALLQLITD